MLVTTPYEQANSYVTYDDAVSFLGQRLYSQSWLRTPAVPDAKAFVVDGTWPAGTSTIPIREGSGTFTAGCTIEINALSYTVQTATVVGATSLVVTTGFSQTVSDGTPVIRTTLSPREAALVWASHILDQSFDWPGYKSKEEYKLRWPRSQVPDPDGYWYDNQFVPEIIQRATAELAMYLLGRDFSRVPAVVGTGLKRGSMPGPFAMEVDLKNLVGMIPPYIRAMLSKIGTPYGGAGGMSFARLYRT